MFKYFIIILNILNLFQCNESNYNCKSLKVRDIKTYIDRRAIDIYSMFKENIFISNIMYEGLYPALVLKYNKENCLLLEVGTEEEYHESITLSKFENDLVIGVRILSDKIVIENDSKVGDTFAKIKSMNKKFNLLYGYDEGLVIILKNEKKKIAFIFDTSQIPQIWHTLEEKELLKKIQNIKVKYIYYW